MPSRGAGNQGRELSYRGFFVWVWQSVYQGGVIMLLAIFLFESSLVNIVAITFTALILAELLNVAFEIHTWNRYIVLSEILTFLLYFASMLILTSYFGTTPHHTTTRFFTHTQLTLGGGFLLCFCRHYVYFDVVVYVESCGDHCCFVLASLFGEVHQAKV